MLAVSADSQDSLTEDGFLQWLAFKLTMVVNHETSTNTACDGDEILLLSLSHIIYDRGQIITS